MKLYATITSERATKGQGGNSYISVDIQDEHGKVLWTISAENNGITTKGETIISVCLLDKTGKQTHSDFYDYQSTVFVPEKIKSKQQKGACTHLFTRSVYENQKLQGYKCVNCGELQKVNPQYQKGKQQKGECQHNYCDDNAICINCGKQQ